MECNFTISLSSLLAGSPEVWHGNVDIIIKNDLIVQNLQKRSESACEELPVKNKIKRSLLNRNPQLAAETIVFSVLQKKLHPSSLISLFHVLVLLVLLVVPCF